MTEQGSTIRLSHLEQTIYFAAQRQGANLLDADAVTRLTAVSRPHAISLLASMARKGVLYRVDRGRYAVIPPLFSTNARAMSPTPTWSLTG